MGPLLQVRTQIGGSVNKEQAVGLAVRLFAIFLVVYTLRYATSVVAFSILEPPDYIGSSLILLVGFSPILIAILLWRFPLTVASKLMPKVTAKEKSKVSSETELQVVAFSTLGLWVIVSAIPDTFYWAHTPTDSRALVSVIPKLTPKTLAVWSQLLPRLSWGSRCFWAQKASWV